jgi:transketolase
MPEEVAQGSAALDELCINTVRVLSMEAVERANSGHPGTAMALAPVCYGLWTRHLRHNPEDPDWLGRDRFVLSCGHASILLYSLLHLSGYDLPLDELKDFRQWNSRTPGHPEHGHTPGVETTTGPLGQGFGNAVGMAIAQARLAAEFGQPGFDLFEHRVYFLASDGDIMEGVSHEVASLAGHLQLGNLIGFYDENGITIDGKTSFSHSDDTAGRFEAYGWHVQCIEDGNDLSVIDRALVGAKADERPSLIIVHTHIAYGSPNKQDTSAAHGAPLGREEIELTKQSLGWEYREPFTVPEEASAEWRRCRERGQTMQLAWQRNLAEYAAQYPQLAQEFSRRSSGELPKGWEDALPAFDGEGAPMATRTASGKVLSAIAPRLPELFGGSADLAASNNTLLEGAERFSRDNRFGRNVFFGIREHGMGSIMNGIGLHGGFIPYGATFLVFSDYMRPAIRLAAMMRLKTIYVFTHDSIGLGEDGPTHQPIEMLAALRAIPNLAVIRPADAAETVEAWRVAIRITGPVVLSLTRQKVPPLDRTMVESGVGVAQGGYILSEAVKGEAQAILIASGSEVAVALGAQQKLASVGIAARVVSMPCMDLFAKQSESYRNEVLPPGVKARAAIEAALPMPWYRWVGDRGAVIGLEKFGASAPADRLYQEFGITADAVVSSVQRLL